VRREFIHMRLNCLPSILLALKPCQWLFVACLADNRIY
jgi:hypothetical protein